MSRKDVLNSLLRSYDTDEYYRPPTKEAVKYKGDDGKDGSEIELSRVDNYIQWKYVDDREWRKLVSIEELKGDKGDPGFRGEQGLNGERGEQGPEGRRIELRLSESHLQWGYVDDNKWYNILHIDKLKGPKGDDGEPGKKGDTGQRGKEGPVGERGLIGPQGPQGERGFRGEPGKNGKDGLNGKDGKDGKDGKTGPVGPAGKEGKQGPKGSKGDKGDKPILGVDYFIQPGPPGRPGRDGRDGLDGMGGIDTLVDASFTYSDGLVQRIEYSDGQYKEFTYNLDNTVQQLVWYRITDTVTKTFSYNLDGTVSSIDVNIT